MDIGFTGTRSGMTAAQKDQFKTLMHELMPDRFDHGSCDGSDADSVLIVRAVIPSCFITAHPGVFSETGKNEFHSKLAEEYSSEVCPPETHFARNRRISRSVDELIATPWQAQNNEPPENSGGGTWYTIRYALQLNKKVRIIWPDGVIEVRNG